MVRVQGGDARVIDDPSLLPQADEQLEVRTESDGWVAGIDALGLGTLAMDLGAGGDEPKTPLITRLALNSMLELVARLKGRSSGRNSSTPDQ